ncbi:MAG: winged helix-turn-helix domain-containing protein [Planctomycetes bacterium]|nr:winged helix-turn-helix domain-containing protein [Planctomycetota bacterium]
MNPAKRDRIRNALRSLAESHAATIKLMEEMSALISEELALDPFTFWKSRPMQPDSANPNDGLQIDREHFTISFDGRTCFFGNSLGFRLLERLARRPNVYLSYEELLAAVWDGVRTDSAVRAGVKRLRDKLRRLEMAKLADAVDGSVSGRYALRLNN